MRYFSRLAIPKKILVAIFASLKLFTCSHGEIILLFFFIADISSFLSDDVSFFDESGVVMSSSNSSPDLLEEGIVEVQGGGLHIKSFVDIQTKVLLKCSTPLP